MIESTHDEAREETRTEPPTESFAEPQAPDVPRVLAKNTGLSDKVFRGVARTGGTIVLLIMLLVGVFPM